MGVFFSPAKPAGSFEDDLKIIEAATFGNEAVTRLRKRLEEMIDLDAQHWVRVEDGPTLAISYHSFGDWRRSIAAVEGIDLEIMSGYGASGKTSWDTVDSKLEALLDHSDCSGELSPEQCRQLVEPLETVLSRIHYSQEVARPFGEDFLALVKFCATKDCYLLFR